MTSSDTPSGPGLKARPEDFLVEEVPSYEPAGAGTHLWMRLAKRGLSTRAAVGRVAKLLGVPPRSIGYAGQKDARAVTRQWISLEHPPQDAAERLAEFAGELGPEVPLVISDLTWHKNRLGLGHLLGNRFCVRLRGVAVEDERRLAARLAHFVEAGAPNAFGAQRFGHRGDGAEIGAALIAGRSAEALERILGREDERDTGRIRAARAHFDAGELEVAQAAWPRDYATERQLLGKLLAGRDAAAALASVDRRDLSFFHAALQSELFNALLAARQAEPGGLGILAGELAMRLPIGRKAFAVEDLAVEQERARRLEISPSGPLFGAKMPWPTAEALRFEEALLESRGLAPADLDGGLPGARRALLMRVDEASSSAGSDEHGAFVELNFTLAKGCYATSLVDALWYAALDE